MSDLNMVSNLFVLMSLVISCLFYVHASPVAEQLAVSPAAAMVSVVPAVRDWKLPDTLTVGQVMKDWESLQSPNKLFQLSFFSPESSNTRYLGIQCVDLLHRVVWVANPGKSLRGTLGISSDGNLVLTDYDGSSILINAEQPAAMSSSNASVTLLDTGNLVLRAGNRVVWQSFDYPSDTWLPGMKLGLFKSSNGHPRQSFLTSWVSDQIPYSGAFTLGVDPNNTKQLLIQRRGVTYWRSGMWNGYNFSYFLDGETNFSYFSNEGQSYFTFTVTDGNFTLAIFMKSSGDIGASQLYHDYHKSSGQTVTSTPSFDSGIYCGEDWGKHYYYPRRSMGCVEREKTNCTAGDVFVQTIGQMSSWNSFHYDVSLGLSDCKDTCTLDCNCSAYASLQPDGTGCKLSDGYKTNGCDGSFCPPIVFDELVFLRKDSTVIETGILLVSNHPATSRKRRLMWSTIGSVVAFLVVTPLCYLFWRYLHFGGNKRRSKNGMSQEAESLLYELKTEAAMIDSHDLTLFTLPSIEIATDFFSDANKIGQGGFGTVYKGKLLNGQEIAVKRLAKSSGQALKEFKNEVILISRIQHRNLVRLLGCCSQAEERILVYEYLPNRSLDSFIFADETRRAILDWKLRVSIIEGIAQGLQYLHKYSRLRIIHRDLKTSNILLDSDMNAKISDFGTARKFADNETQANTRRIVGTYGYMSPEYALDGLFSVKSDVFSFGVMMLEIICGKKNTGFYQPDRVMNLLGYAWDLWKEGRGLEIMDHVLVETCSPSEVMRHIEV